MLSNYWKPLWLKSTNEVWSILLWLCNIQWPLVLWFSIGKEDKHEFQKLFSTCHALPFLIQYFCSECLFLILLMNCENIGLFPMWNSVILSETSLTVFKTLDFHIYMTRKSFLCIISSRLLSCGALPQMSPQAYTNWNKKKVYMALNGQDSVEICWNWMLK